MERGCDLLSWMFFIDAQADPRLPIGQRLLVRFYVACFDQRRPLGRVGLQ